MDCYLVESPLPIPKDEAKPIATLYFRKPHVYTDKRLKKFSPTTYSSYGI